MIRWPNLAIHDIVGLLFSVTYWLGTETDAGTESDRREFTFNALVQFCLLNGLIWLLLILLQASRKDLFYYKRDITAVVFETRSPSEAFKISWKRSKEVFTQTERRFLKSDANRQEAVYRKQRRRLRLRFTRLRTKLARSYKELVKRKDANTVLLAAEKKSLEPMLKVRDGLIVKKDNLVSNLRDEIQRHGGLVYRYKNCYKAIFGNSSSPDESVDILAAGDYSARAEFDHA